MTMRIKAGQMIAGLPAVRVRKFLKAYTNPVSWNIEYFFKVEDAEARRIGDRLIAEGYLEINPEPCPQVEYARYRPTKLGMSLASASAMKKIKRETATRILHEFVQRALEVQQDSRFLVQPNPVVLYGSYVRNEPLVSDIDIAFALERKVKDEKKWEELVRLHAPANAHLIRNMADRYCWWDLAAWKHLQAGNRYLSLHTLQDFAVMPKDPNFSYQVIQGSPSFVKRLLQAMEEEAKVGT